MIGGSALVVLTAVCVGAFFLLRGDDTRPPTTHPSSAPTTPAPPPVATNDGTDANRPVMPDSDTGFMDPRGGWGWGDKCWTSLRAGKWGWAKAECDRGMAMNPASPQPRASLLYNEGLVAKSAGKIDEARQDFASSLALRENAEVRAALNALTGGRGSPMNPGEPGFRDARRNFTRSEVIRAWELQGRVCKLCRRAIPADLMHGDHITPWVRGGLTVMTNLQALCGSCNLRKGSRPQEIIEQFFDVAKYAPASVPLRRWQSEALQCVLPAVQTEPVLVEACPGAGKTTFGLTVAYRLFEARGDFPRAGCCSDARHRGRLVEGRIGHERVIADSAVARPTELETCKILSAMGGLEPCSPTSRSFAMTDMILAHATDPGHRTLVIFDEVHHVGAGSGWGQSAQTAFCGGLTAVLSLSGTPFRTDGEPIVFVPSVGGAAKPHYRYSYRDAIVDGACRPVQFVEVRGRTTFRTEDGEVHDVSFEERPHRPRYATPNARGAGMDRHWIHRRQDASGCERVHHCSSRSG